MTSNRIKKTGILSKLLEQGIKIFLKKECNKIDNLKIDIIASSLQIIKGVIPKIHIKASDINYKNLLFDEIELEADDVKILLKKNNKELDFKNNLIINLKISLSETSLKNILFSKNWNWIGDIISNEISNQVKLEDIKIENDKIFFETSNKRKTINKNEKFDIKTEDGKLYLKNKAYRKSIQIPIEDKIFFKNVNIHNDLIKLSAESSISF